MTEADFKLGKLPAQPARPKLRFASIAAQLAAPPVDVDWTTGVEDWPSMRPGWSSTTRWPAT
jgi:hypothetical protein